MSNFLKKLCLKKLSKISFKNQIKKWDKILVTAFSHDFQKEEKENSEASPFNGYSRPESPPKLLRLHESTINLFKEVGNQTSSYLPSSTGDCFNTSFASILHGFNFGLVELYFIKDFEK